MGRLLGPIGYIAYLVLGILQLAAVYAFLHDYWGWNFFLAFFVGLLLAYAPVIGTICGIIGAIYVWHWAWWQAGLLFLWWVPLLIIISIFSLIGSKEST